MMAMNPFRILIAAEPQPVRRGLQWIIEQQPDWQICAEAEDAGQLPALASAFSPDLLLLDLALPGMIGLETVRQFRRTLPQTKVLVFGRTNSEVVLWAVMTAGAHGYLCLADTASLLVAAIQGLSQDLPFFAVETTVQTRQDHSLCFRPTSDLPAISGPPQLTAAP